MDNNHPRTTLSGLARDLDLPPRFAALSSGERLRAILDLRDPGRLVRSLRPDDLYFLLTGIGMGDAHDLLIYATPEQRQAVVDLDAWSGWHYQPQRLDQMLSLALGVSIDFAMSLVRDMDGELMALHLFGRATVTLVREEEDTPTALDHSFMSPDNVFMVSCRDPDDVEAIRKLLDVLYAVGVQFAQGIILAGMRDTVASLENLAFHFRDNRLQDLGFAPFDERFELWEPYDTTDLKARLDRDEESGPARHRDDQGKERPLALTLQDSDGGLFFWKAASLLGDRPELSELVGNLLFLVNRVLSARAEDLSQDRVWEKAASHAATMLSLGLEHLAEGNPERASQYLLKDSPQAFYRAGIEYLRPLNVAAIRVVRDVGGLHRLSILGQARAETVKAALVFPPQMWTGPETDGSDSRRDFITRDEVDRALGTVTGAGNVLTFATVDLGFRFDTRVAGMGPRGAPTLATVLATAWARQVLQGRPSTDPLSGEEIRDLLAAAFQDGVIRPGLRVIGMDVTPEVATFIEEMLDTVEETLGHLDPSRPLETRFLGNVLLVGNDEP
ncbi:MAG: hypothetical protein ISR64_10935 [Deltaproteobacteria bacterium]|nr:hypothetical protein [Deltaproteobacteria bacterium]